MDHYSHWSSWLTSAPWHGREFSVPVSPQPHLLYHQLYDCNMNAGFVLEVVRVEWKLWTAMTLPAHSEPSLRWWETEPDTSHWVRTTKTKAWLCSLLKCAIWQREQFTHAVICISSLHVWRKTARKNFDVKYELFTVQFERVWRFYFTSSWLRQMLTMAS